MYFKNSLLISSESTTGQRTVVRSIFLFLVLKYDKYIYLVINRETETEWRVKHEWGRHYLIKTVS